MIYGRVIRSELLEHDRVRVTVDATWEGGAAELVSVLTLDEARAFPVGTAVYYQMRKVKPEKPAKQDKS